MYTIPLYFFKCKLANKTLCLIKNKMRKLLINNLKYLGFIKGFFTSNLKLVFFFLICILRPLN